MRAKLPHTEGFVDRGGVKIHYEIYGEGEHTILFVPAWAIVHSRMYKAQIPYFSDRFRVICYDPRGNGRSDRPAADAAYSLDELADDAIAVLDAAGVERATLYGLSMGASVSAMVAAYFPEEVEAVVSVSGRCPLVAGHVERNASKFDVVFENPQGWEKFNRAYWLANYPDFCEFFLGKIFPEKHSTKQVQDGLEWAAEGAGETLARTVTAPLPARYPVNEAMYRRIKCPVLLIHGADDTITPPAMSEKVAELTGGDLHILPGVGHAANARFPAWTNTLARDFLAKKLGTWKPERKARTRREKRALYLSSPIGLGHARRDLAIARELRAIHPGLQIDWLAQDPVTRLLTAKGETIHGASKLLALETQHIEEEAGEHDLNCFEAIRNMDEIMVRNFMVFQEAVESDHYDLVIADEAWEIDHYWHEHPQLKQAQMAWLTDFVGWAPMPAGGEREAFLTADYNAEMIGHVEGHPGTRDRAIFVGNPRDIAPLGFGPDLPAMRNWIPKHFDFSGYVIGEHPSTFGPREELRQRLGYKADEVRCIVAVGGSGVGGALIRRILSAYPIAKRRIPNLVMTVVTGPRIDPASFAAPAGVEMRAFVPDLDRHLAACDLALVQGGLSTTMELAAAGTPFLYFPLQNHFEQNIHVAHRLESYGAGRRMDFATSDPDAIAAAMVAELSSPRRPLPVEKDGAARAAAMLAELL
jgi:pimeloyl-ACP methyl ester carboxylesterase/spore coat polysaccharide biosynthesis predicted glycosyltransferase SpsG